MNAPVVWIFTPAAAAIILYLIRRWERAIHFFGLIIALLLAFLAWQLPIDQPFNLGIPGVAPLRLQESFPILGQSLSITAASQPALILIYLGISIWYGGAYIAGVNRLFIPLGLAIASFITASITIEPKTYSIILVELAALLCIPILTPPGQPIRRGVLRFLIFQTTGMILILLADWLIKTPVKNLDPTAIVPGALFILGLGFALIAAIFPFHTWIPMLAGEAHPYSAAFVFFLLPTSFFFWGLSYLNDHPGLSSSPVAYSTIAWSGLLMVLAGGAWALFERHLGRILGFAAMTQIGMGLLAISLTGSAAPNSPIAGVFFAQLFPQLIGFAVWALSLTVISQQKPSLQFRNVQGLVREMPVAVASLGIASFSLAGAPLLASFPSFTSIWASLVSVSPTFSIGALLGCVMLFAAELRSLAVLVMAPRIIAMENKGEKYP